VNSKASQPSAKRPAPPRGRPASAGPTASAAEAAAKITPARAAAFEILTLIAVGNSTGKGHSDELLHSPRTADLTADDHNLTTALVMGVLRWQIALDARLARLLARPGQRLAEPVAIVLRMGAFQLLHMDRIPAHAVLNESVELCRAAGQPQATGMVNAVLRKLAAAQKPSSRIFESPAAFGERLAHPRWLVERWVATYGREATLALCEYDQREPHPGHIFPAPPGEANPSAANPSDALPQMDDGSRLIAEIAASALPSTAGPAPRIWDCCAAPGGKTLILAKRLPAVDLLATDISSKRLTATQARFRRYAYGAAIRTEVADATSPNALPNEAAFDLILCDVPCSGTGTLARNPEIRLRLQPEDLARQSARQREILSHAAARLAPGGRIVYSTCSLEPEENEAVIDSVVSTTELRRVPVESCLEALLSSGILPPEIGANLIASATRNGVLRTLPGTHPCDGFFAAILERN
jgi:16S rRNA (cytosine967-C5)-methyltransferase